MGKEFEESWPPGTEAVLKPGQSGSQIVCFEFITEGSLQYSLFLAPNDEISLEIPMEYTIFRNDQWGNPQCKDGPCISWQSL